jgi:hypothetical protein
MPSKDGSVAICEGSRLRTAPRFPPRQPFFNLRFRFPNCPHSDLSPLHSRTFPSVGCVATRGRSTAPGHRPRRDSDASGHCDGLGKITFGLEFRNADPMRPRRPSRPGPFPRAKLLETGPEHRSRKDGQRVGPPAGRSAPNCPGEPLYFSYGHHQPPSRVNQ